MAKPKTLDEIYASLPTIQCQGKCQAGCGPIGLLGAEVDRLTEKHIPLPNLHHCPRWGLSCSALKINGQCSIYSDRPLICRLFGLVKRMQCPYGCQPERWLSDKEAARLMKAVESLSKTPSAIPTINNPLLAALTSHDR